MPDNIDDGDAQEKSKGGRPTKYNTDVLELAGKLALTGFTDAQMADCCNVSVRTWNYWKKTYPEFLHTIKKGKDIADAQVVASLYHRACGYSHPETKLFAHEGFIVDERQITKHYAPDTTAGIFWLKNRMPDKFRDKQDVAITDEGVVRISLLGINDGGPSEYDDPEENESGEGDKQNKAKPKAKAKAKPKAKAKAKAKPKRKAATRPKNGKT